MKYMTPLLLAAVTVGLSACDNDFKDKPAAQVSQAAERSEAAPDEPATAKDKPAATHKAEALSVDSASSSIGWVGAKVTGKHEGEFKQFKGSAQVEGNELKSISFEVETASVVSDAEKLTGHLKSADFFEVEKYPKASFRTTGITEKPGTDTSHEITGDLTLRGVTKSITFPAKVEVGKESVKGSAEFTINRQDFGITYPGMKDDLIKDDVLLKLQLSFPRQ